MSGPRILYLDIETSPLEVRHWSLWDDRTGLEQIVTEWSLLSFAAQFEGGQLEYLDNRGKANPRDDFHLLSRLWILLDEADLVVTQNGKKFDHRKINARLVEHGFPPPSPFTMIDTREVAKRVFGFTSNKLEWMSNHLTAVPKLKHKKFPGFELWKACLAGDPRAWAEMERYNKQDVRALRAVYLKLRPWMEQHPNVGSYHAGSQSRCPKCGSTRLQRRGFRVRGAAKYVRFQCRACRGWSRGRENVLTTSAKRAMIHNS